MKKITFILLILSCFLIGAFFVNSTSVHATNEPLSTEEIEQIKTTCKNDLLISKNEYTTYLTTIDSSYYSTIVADSGLEDVYNAQMEYFDSNEFITYCQEFYSSYTENKDNLAISISNNVASVTYFQYHNKLYLANKELCLTNLLSRYNTAVSNKTGKEKAEIEKIYLDQKAFIETDTSFYPVYEELMKKYPGDNASITNEILSNYANTNIFTIHQNVSFSTPEIIFVSVFAFALIALTVAYFVIIQVKHKE